MLQLLEMHAHHKDWKLSGIRRIYRNTLMAEIGQFGTGPGKLIWPTALTLTPEGDLAVKDSGNNRIQIFSREGFHKHGFSFGSKSVKCLGDIAATADGRLLVTDGSKAVKVFAKDGELIHQLKPPKMDWKSSHGLALLPCGNLAVTDWTDGGKIHIISVDWRNNAILKMNVMEGFVRPVQISVNKNEDLLVAEGQLFGQYEGRCVKIIENKKIKMKIGPELGNRHCFVNPSGVCVDRDGNILVTDEGQNCITMFNPNASLSAYVVNHELQGPFGICITNEGHLAVADCYHSCVKLYRYR